MEQVFLTVKKIVSNLKERINKRVDNMGSDSMFAAVETLLDTKSYRRSSADAVYEVSMVIVQQFKSLLEKIPLTWISQVRLLSLLSSPF